MLCKVSLSATCRAKYTLIYLFSHSLNPILFFSHAQTLTRTILRQEFCARFSGRILAQDSHTGFSFYFLILAPMLCIFLIFLEGEVWTRHRTCLYGAKMCNFVQFCAISTLLMSCQTHYLFRYHSIQFSLSLISWQWFSYSLSVTLS